MLDSNQRPKSGCNQNMLKTYALTAELIVHMEENTGFEPAAPCDASV